MSDRAAEIEAVVLETPGVVAVYRTGSAVSKLIDAMAEQLTGSEEAANRVTVTQGADDRDEIEIAIGVESDAAAVETAQAVRERVAALFAGTVPGPLVRITVVHVVGE